MVLNIKDTDVGIQYLNFFTFLDMSHFGNTKCFLQFLSMIFLAITHLSSKILLLIYFPSLLHRLLTFLMQDNRMIILLLYSKYPPRLLILNLHSSLLVRNSLEYVNHLLIFMIIIVFLPLFPCTNLPLIRNLALILCGNKQ